MDDQPVNPTPPPSPEPPKTLGWIKWVLVIPIVALLSSGVTYLVVKSQSKSQTPQPVVQTPPSITPTPDQTQNKSADNQMLGWFYWDVTSNSLPKKIEEEIKATFASFDPKTVFQDGQHFAVVGIHISTTSPIWATAGIQLRDKENNVIPTDGLEYLLDKRQGRWTITKPSDNNFCDVLKAAPDDLISKEYYIECK